MRLLLEGCYGYLLVPSLITKHLSAISFLGTNSHAHLLGMSLIINQWVISGVMLIF